VSLKKRNKLSNVSLCFLCSTCPKAKTTTKTKKQSARFCFEHQLRLNDHLIFAEHGDVVMLGNRMFCTCTCRGKAHLLLTLLLFRLSPNQNNHSIFETSEYRFRKFFFYFLPTKKEFVCLFCLKCSIVYKYGLGSSMNETEGDQMIVEVKETTKPK
jgi:hypothetical protein